MITMLLGNVVRISVVVTDLNLVPQDVIGLTFTAKAPDGSIIGPNPFVHDGAVGSGTYHYDYQPLLPNGHLYKVTSTSPPAAYNSVINVRPQEF